MESTNPVVSFLARMMRSMALVCTLLAGTIGCEGKSDRRLNCSTPWINAHLEWISPEEAPSIVYAVTPILYFDSSGYFKVLGGFTYRKSVAPCIYQFGNEGGTAIVGTWRWSGSGIVIRSRVVNRAVRREGEELPGKFVTDAVQVLPDTGEIRCLVFRGDTFLPTDCYDSSSLKVIRHKVQR